MFLSQWKMMAGVLVVSLGALAAMAGQCPKSEPTKGTPPETPVASAPAATPTVPPPAPSSLPPLPMAEPEKMPPVVPAGGASLPPLPMTGPISLPVVPAATPPASSVPVIPASGIPDATPRTPPPLDPLVVTVPTPPMPAGSTTSPPMSVPADPGPFVAPPMPSVKPAVTVPDGGTTSMEMKHAKLAASKYRILLRVGEGEPVFEVRCGDDLMLKVICEKVDVKSPEKGQGLSSVKASGKVRFSGFGAEGTCDELNFLAGTGEVGMAGHVKIQVKDKLGRVESELSAETMKYKIDPHTIAGNGTMKP